MFANDGIMAQSLSALVDAEETDIKDRRGEAGNTHECYARILDAAEKAAAASDRRKEIQKNLWDACKSGDAESFDAYIATMFQIALTSAQWWIIVAAEANRARLRTEDEQ